MRSHLLTGLALALSLFSSACVSVLPEPETAEALYRIEPLPEGAELAETLIVREPEAARLFAGTALVSENDQGGLRLIRGVEWAGPATRMLQLALVDSFSQTASGAAVLPESGVRARYELSSRVQTLGLVRDMAVCRVVVSLIDGHNRRLMAQTQIEARQAPVTLAAVDRAMALKQASQTCVADMADFAAASLLELQGTPK